VVLAAFIRPHLINTWNSIHTVTSAQVHHRSPKFSDLTEVRTDIADSCTHIIHAQKDMPKFKEIQTDKNIWRIPEILVYPGCPQVQHNGNLI
jgi:hypothetical protein